MHDLFELAVDLIFDPPETNADRVLIAMRKAEQGFIGLLRSETETIKMNELNAKIAFLQQIRKEIFEDYHNYPNCKRLSRGFRELALKRTEIEIAKLKSAVDTLAAVGKKVITEGSLNRQKQNSGIRLSIENIEKVYQDAGFTIQKTSKAAKPQFPARIEYISENLKRIRGFSQYRQFYPTSPDNADVDDLYAFIAFLENDPKNAARYRAKTTPEIKKILDDQALKIAPREETARDPLGKIIKDTISMSKSNVFNNDANREKYEKYLLYKLPELSLLFQRLKNAPKDYLRDSEFAEDVIKRIAEIFGNREEALAIYNYEAGISSDPYEPIKPIFNIKCAYCRYLAEFETEQDAKKSNSCPNCSKRLYKKCGNQNCNKLILDSLDKCPECGFMFESKAMFGNYINLVQEALQKNDFNVARQYLSRAKSANPDEKTKTDQLLLDIEKAEKLYNIANPPKPVENLEISVDNFNWRVTISWSPSQEPGEKNIKYRILRKPGSEIPKNEMDGDIIQDDLEETTYCDINIPPGIQYSYGIFTKRRGGFSGAVGDSVMLLAEIGGLHYEQHEKSDGTQALRISWKTPQNCVGVRIIRINNANGEKKILANNAISLYEDTDLEHSVSYVYLLYAKYFGHPPSAGVRFTTAISPNVKIKPFNIRAEHVRGAKYTIYWKITEPDIDLRIKLNKRTVLRDNLKSDMGNCEIELPLNGNHTIFVEACSSGKWIKSANYIEINTFIPPEIEVKTAEITEIVYHYRGIANGFRVKFPITLVENLENIKNLTGFCYAVRISDEYSRSSHWVAANEINSAPDIIRVSKEQYLKDGKIECEMIIQEQGFFYITFFAVYNQDGKEIISKPCRKKIERPILASVIWKVVKRAFGKPKLILEINANKPAMRHPRFVLCALDAHSKRPWSLNDAKKSGAKILLDIFETNFVSPKKIFYDEYSITEPIGKNKKLFLFGIDLEEGERYTPQWADGFRGEI